MDIIVATRKKCLAGQLGTEKKKKKEIHYRPPPPPEPFSGASLAPAGEGRPAAAQWLVSRGHDEPCLCVCV